MVVTEVLRDILVVLVAAKLAAEVAERIGVPAVVGEILAGILIGPSGVGLVGSGDEVLRTLGEIGVILLLLEVGMGMNLEELGRVGRASLLVASVGVVAPMLLGIGAMHLLGHDFNIALFIGAALTATSVGITARVFSDLRALATNEARMVLGAAVADDVMGLVVLTVVVRLVNDGSVSLLAVLAIVGVALAFLLVSAVAGLRLAPLLFGAIERVSRSTGTMIAIALAFALAFAEIASLAQLAPIVGAFVAGLALGRSGQRERIGRELAPVGHLFIPVFFLQIGIDVDVSRFVDLGVLATAAFLLVAAVLGKMVSAFGATGTPGDRWLIGFGMLPRGEVGLIFAAIGLQGGVLGPDLYAALLLVVLVTTLVTPQLLKMRYTALRSDVRSSTAGVANQMPAGGWLRVMDDEVGLTATPPSHMALPIALEAASRVGSAQPAAELLDWLSQVTGPSVQWDRRSTRSLLSVLQGGNARSWRFLETVGILDRALPELAETIRTRMADPFQLDPMNTHRWALLEELRSLAENDPALADQYRTLAHPEWLLLAALLIEGLDGQASPVATARRIVRRLDLGAKAEQEIAGLIEDRELLWAAAFSPDGLSEGRVLQLASHLDTPERARALFLLAMARGADREGWERMRLAELHQLVQELLEHPELTGLEARNLSGRRRAEAMRLVGDDQRLIQRLEHAPLAYVLRHDSAAIARHARLLEELPSQSAARVQVAADDASGVFTLDIAARDRPGLLANVTAVLAGIPLTVSDAVVATWPDGMALESFRIASGALPDVRALEMSIEQNLDRSAARRPLPEASVSFDDESSPWHTVCEIGAPERPGLLHDLAAALAAAAIDVQSARVTTGAGIAVGRFDVTNRSGAKLTSADKAALRALITAGGPFWRRRGVLARFSLSA